MIEFYGELSEKCKIARMKKISKNNGFMSLIFTILGSIPVLIFGIINDVWYYALALIVLFVIITVVAFIPSKRFLCMSFATRLVIENDIISTTAVGGKKSLKTKPISKIKKIVDMGEWYNIIFKFGDITNSWVCQKDLIKLGSLEEFEKLFEGIIIRV